MNYVSYKQNGFFDQEFDNPSNFSESETKLILKLQHNSIFLGRSASGPIGPPLFHFYFKASTVSSSNKPLSRKSKNPTRKNFLSLLFHRISYP
jgi:hypothetical protein